MNTESAFGFNNIAPRGREGRREYKEYIEKKRLAERRTGFVRHEFELNPMKVEEDAAGFISDADRFHTDTAGEQRRIRNREIARKNEIIENHRRQNIEREEARWANIEAQRRKEEERWQQMAGTSERNSSSVPYNLVNLKFGDGKDAERGRFLEEQVEYIGAQRAQFLYGKTSGDGFNPITGEPLPARITIPEKPRPPQDYDKWKNAPMRR